MIQIRVGKQKKKEKKKIYTENKIGRYVQFLIEREDFNISARYGGIASKYVDDMICCQKCNRQTRQKSDPISQTSHLTLTRFCRLSSNE